MQNTRAFSLKRMIARSKTVVLSSLLAVASSLGASKPALANGRFPRAERLIESPTDSNKLYLAATYGLLVTTDRGCTWYHVCEAAFSFESRYTGDPVVSLTGNGSLLVGTQASLSLSTDNACDWTQTLVSPASPKESFFDLTVAASAPHPIIVGSTSYQPTGPVNQLHESTDGGMTWKPIGTPLPLALLNTVDVDPTDPTHIYATGLTTTTDALDTGVFVSSTDHGASWSSNPIPNTYAWANPYIARIHPTDPKKIFVRTDGWKDRDVVETADDALLYSSDGGKTWKEILHPGGPADSSPGAKLFGFALSPDGSTVLAGYGDPVDSARFVEPSWFGVYKSSTDGQFSFGPDPANPLPPILPAEPISCITWNKTGIYVCFEPGGEDSFLGFATAPNFTSRASMTTLMKVNQTKGVPPNCMGRAVTTCDWTVDCLNLDACDGGAATGSGAAGGTTCAMTGVDAGTGGSVDQPKSCNCRAPGRASSDGGQAIGWLFAAMVVRRRRRRIRHG